jgi:hypothetical protein
MRVRLDDASWNGKPERLRPHGRFFGLVHERHAGVEQVVGVAVKDDRLIKDVA